MVLAPARSVVPCSRRGPACRQPYFTREQPMKRTALLFLAAATPTFAQQSVSIDLTGLQLKNATNQSRTSSPNTISPSFRFSSVISGHVRGFGGAFGFLYPTSTPLATVLEDLAPGSSSMLSGTFDNCTGTHPLSPTDRKSTR